MWLTQAAFIGIVPAAKQPMTYAALDAGHELLAIASGDFAEVIAFCGGQRQAVVAIAAPSGPSLGLLQQPANRDALGAALQPGRWKNGRIAEYMLRRHNIRMLSTPSDENAAPAWMQAGFRLFRHLRAMGYRPYPAADSPHQVLETYPYAVFTTLLGLLPFHKHTLEGRIQRQLLLREQGLDLPNPLRIFEEFTRHRLLSGILPTRGLFTPPELDALAAAWTAFKAAHAPESVTAIGHEEEGQIILPVDALKPRYAAGKAL